MGRCITHRVAMNIDERPNLKIVRITDQHGYASFIQSSIRTSIDLIHPIVRPIITKHIVDDSSIPNMRTMSCLSETYLTGSMQSVSISFHTIELTKQRTSAPGKITLGCVNNLDQTFVTAGDKM